MPVSIPILSRILRLFAHATVGLAARVRIVPGRKDANGEPDGIGI